MGACNTASLPPNINQPNEFDAPLIYAANSAKYSDDEQFAFYLATQLPRAHLFILRKTGEGAKHECGSYRSTALAFLLCTTV